MVNFCPRCYSQIHPSDACCRTCGMPLNNGGRGNPSYAPRQQEAYQQSHFDVPSRRSNSRHDEDDISIGMWIRGFLLSIITFGIAYIFWLFGASKYRARVTYARASFIFGMIISIIFTVLWFVILSAILPDLLNDYYS